MAYIGRQKIYTDYDVINDDNVLTIINEANNKYLYNVGEIEYLYNYYKGFQPILSRTKTIRPEICNKVVENHANEIVAFKSSFLLWRPIQYISRKGIDKVDEIATLNDFMILENKEKKDLELAKWQSICGTAYRCVLPNKAYNGGINESPFHIYTLDPRECYVIYTSHIGESALANVFVSIEIDENNNKQTIYQVYTDTKLYKIKNGIIISNDENPIGLPLVEYPLNDERLGDFEKVLSLLDAINLTQSDRVDGVEQFIQALLVFKNVDINKKELEMLKEMGAIKISSKGDVVANVEYLNQELNQTQVQTLVDSMYNIVLRIVGMPSVSSGNSYDSSNNGAVILKNGWQNAEASANSVEISFKASEREFLKKALNQAYILSLKKFYLLITDFDIKYTRRQYENTYQQAQMFDLLLKNEKVPMKQAYEVCGLFADPESAYQEAVEYEKERKLNEQENNDKD